MSIARHHTEWLSLVPVSGPFLSLPVLLEAFSVGLEPHDPDHVRLLRQEYDEWRVMGDGGRVIPRDRHYAFIRFILQVTLDLPDNLLLQGQSIPQTLQVEIPEHGELLRPDFVLVSPPSGNGSPATNHAPRLLIQTYARSQDLSSYVSGSTWKASPDTRMTELLHGTGVRLGLVTNGEHWMLVDAPKGETSGYASWYASLWLDEPITLRAFRSLLSVQRFFGVPDDQTLESLLAKSASNQQEVTDQLGYQVRKAVEVLIYSLDKADQDFGRELLADVTPEQLYESALTVMMRLVFLFCAEERELIPSKPFPVYEQNYSVCTISRQLRELADQHGEELLERRYDAWQRLLAAFRAVYGGLQHIDIHIPAYGGSLFNPDRFPFLEGRKAGTTWRVMSGGWRDQARNAGVGTSAEESYGGSALSGTGRVAGGNGPGGTVLSHDESVPGGGTLRDDDADSSGRVISASKHRRGSGTSVNKGVPAFSGDSERLAVGAGDTSAAQSESGIVDTGSCGATPGAVRSGQQTPDRSVQSAGATPVKPATRHQPLATPLPVNNRTVLHLLEALQLLQIKVPGGGPAEARRVSFRALDIEQIGHVYEGLLDHTAKRAVEPYLGLAGTRDKEPEISLAELERVAGDGWCVAGEEPKPSAAFLKFLKEQTGRSESALRKAIVSPATHHDPLATQRFRTAANSDDSLWQRIRPLAGLVRMDTFGYPVVIPQGSVFVTSGTDRRSSGTHYTPRSLTEPIVQYTLEPLVYIGPAEGLPKSEWKLKSAKELLALKICDMACGSGAFLVQATRYMAERLLEAWELAREANPRTPNITPEGEPSAGGVKESLIPEDPTERKLYAMRLIAQRCIYGVDKNPLAVEMAKLSLWLLTMAKDKPFEFLDHSIRSGDSLVGLHSIDQLRHFSLKPDADDAVLFRGPLDEAVDEAIELRLRLEDLPANTVEDVQRQEQLLAEANEKIARLRCAADLLVAAEYWGENAKDKLERVRHAAVVSGHYVEKGPTEEFQNAARRAWENRGPGSVNREASKDSVNNVSRPTDHASRSTLEPFHWPLEFPEVIVKRGGFDAFVGNPPFLGGIRIRSILGADYLKVLQSLFGGGNRADLCAYFILRAFILLRVPGCFGVLATNTIAQGDSREFGLDPLVVKSGTIFRAVPSRKWPGTATLEIAEVWVWRGKWGGTFTLREDAVTGISTLLTESESSATPCRLFANRDLSYKGVDPMGAGFLLESDEAQRLLATCEANSSVVMPFLNGQDLYSRPDQSASRHAIYFRDWPLDRVSMPSYSGPVAADYPHCLAIISERVKPYRQQQAEGGGEFQLGKSLAEKWWLFNRPRMDLFAKITQMRRVLIRPEVSNTHAMVFLSPQNLFSNVVCVFVFDSDTALAVLQSTMHEVWARQYSSSMRTDMRYTTADCFETFPFPVFLDELDPIGERYHVHRQRVTLARQEGLTKTYNRFHNPAETSNDIQKLRDLHVEMDQAVAAAYGWTDLDLGHGFHETKQGIRFTISEPARREVLQRLLKLNHERYAEEVRQGLHGKKGAAGRGTSGGKKAAAGGKAAAKKADATADKKGPSLFREDTDE